MKLTRRARGEDGSAAVELLLAAPVFLFITFVCVQFAAIFFAWLSVLTTARDVTRWITMNPNTTDTAAIANVDARLPSDLNASNLTITVSPSCAALVSGKCPGRTVGSDIGVTLTYDISSVYFLPTSFTFVGGYSLTFPTTLPSYTMHMEAEPSI